MVPREELDCRHASVRQEMAKQGYDALLVAGNAESLQRGYIRYLTDWRLWHGHGFLVLPLENVPALSLLGGSQAYWAERAGWSRPKPASGGQIGAVVETLRAEGLSSGTIGVVGMDSTMRLSDMSALRKGLPDADLGDATALLDSITMIKSPEEIRRATETYRLLARALDGVEDVLRPGKSERQVVAHVIRGLAQDGCVDGIVHLSTEPLPYIRPPSDRIITETDTIKIQLEYAGPWGYWAELAGIFSFREPPVVQQRHHDTIVRAMGRVLPAMRPGATLKEVSELARKTHSEDGWTLLSQAVGDYHGIGLNLVEPPIGGAAPGDALAENMVVMVGTSAFVAEHEWGVFVPENVVITADGAQPLHPYEHRWRVLTP